jgi:hypothetical protein
MKQGEWDNKPVPMSHYIAGYTYSGVPFGITQAEIEKVECGPNKKEKLLMKSNIVVENDNLPF